VCKAVRKAPSAGATRGWTIDSTHFDLHPGNHPESARKPAIIARAVRFAEVPVVKRPLSLLGPWCICFTFACQTVETITDWYYVDAGPEIPAGGTGGRGGSGVGGRGTGGSAGTSAMAGTGGAAGGGGAGTADAADPATTADAGPPADAGVQHSAGDTGTTPAARAFNVAGVAGWRGNAAGAYSVVHEVGCDSTSNGIFKHAHPEMMSRGLRGGFGLVVNGCERDKRWDTLKAMAAYGHDLINNSLSYACLTGNAGNAGCAGMGIRRSTDYAMEIDNAATQLQQKAGVVPGFFLFPYEVCETAALNRVKQRGYLGTRCGGQGINPTSFADPYKLAFDLWGPAQSRYGTAAACNGFRAGARPSTAPAACRTHVLSKLVEDAISGKGWAMRGFHGFDDDMGGYEPVSAADYRAHLDFLKQKVDMGQLWVDGPTAVVKYRMAREHCPPPAISGGNTLRFGTPSAMCSKYATTLSYLVSSADGADVPALAVVQAGQRLGAKKLGPGSFVVDADPTKGDAVLTE
jgi:hypothetical protein